MWPNPQFHADLVTFNKEILNGKLHFLCKYGHNHIQQKKTQFLLWLWINIFLQLFLSSWHLLVQSQWLFIITEPWIKEVLMIDISNGSLKGLWLFTLWPMTLELPVSNFCFLTLFSIKKIPIGNLSEPSN